MELKKSEVLDYDSMKPVKDNLIAISVSDGKQDFRVDVLEYIDMTSDNDNDDYMYNAMKYIRFLPAGSEEVAYTDPKHGIFLNVPYAPIGEKASSLPVYNTIYYHECLHQIWDTFGVEADIVKKHGNCDHYLLNVASDCVINDYLANVRKMPLFEGGITPEYMDQTYKITYDRNKDTQYTLYMRLVNACQADPSLRKKMDSDKRLKPAKIEISDIPQPPRPPMPPPSKDYVRGWQDGIDDAVNKKVDPLTYNPRPVKNDYDQGYNDVLARIKQGMEHGITVGTDDGPTGGGGLPQIPWDKTGIDPKKLNKDNKDNKDNQDNNNNNGNDGSGGGGGKTAKDAQNSANNAKRAADRAKDAANKAKDSDSGPGTDGKKTEDTPDAKSAQASADKAQKAADRAQEAADAAAEAARKGDKSEEEKQAKIAAEAEREAEELAQQADPSQTNTGNINNGSSGNSKGVGHDEDTNPRFYKYPDVEDGMEELAKEYQNKLAGTFGKYIEQIKKSKACIDTGLEVRSLKGANTWITSTKGFVRTYIENRIFRLKMKMKSTYSRIRRGSKVVFGQPIKAGKKPVDESLIISVALYVDRSGSMESCIRDVWKALYELCESIKKSFAHEKLVSDTVFSIHAFDEAIHPIKYGNMMSADNGTAPFDKILDYMRHHTKEYLITIILTDGQMDYDKQNVKDYFNDKEMNGLVVFITCDPQPAFKKLAKEFPTQMKYVEAPNKFQL